MSVLKNSLKVAPTMLLDFKNHKATHPCVQSIRSVPAIVCNQDLDYVTVGPMVPRIAYDPKTGECIGLMSERASVTYNDNSILQINPSTGITYGGYVIPDSSVNITILGNGVECGLPYLDIRLRGTFERGYYDYYFSQSVPKLAPTTFSLFCKVLNYNGEDNKGISVFNREYSLVTGYNDTIASTNALFLRNKPLSACRLEAIKNQGFFTSYNDGDVANNILVVSVTAGVYTEIDIRIACPQWQSGVYATSPVLTPVGITGSIVNDANHMQDLDKVLTRNNLCVVDFICPLPSPDGWNDIFILSDSAQQFTNHSGVSITNNGIHVIAGVGNVATIAPKVGEKCRIALYTGENGGYAFINGEPVINNDSDRSFQPKSAQLGATHLTNGGASFFNGCLERVSIYSGTRTADEVRLASIFG